MHFDAHSSIVILMNFHVLVWLFFPFNMFLQFILFLHLFVFRNLFLALAVCTNKFITGARSIESRRATSRWKAKRKNYKFHVEVKSIFGIKNGRVIR